MLRSLELKQVWLYPHLQQKLIPKATNREPEPLIVVVPVKVAIDAVQVAVPGVCRTGLCSAPPDGVVVVVVPVVELFEQAAAKKFNIIKDLLF